MKYDLAVYIGRFQPFHLGHLHVLEQAKKIAKHTLVLVGSSSRPRTLKNPFSFGERSGFVKKAAASIDHRNILVRPLRDFVYRDDQWSQHVQANVQDVATTLARVQGRKPEEIRVALIGHYKDDSSWYLKEFPQWDLVQLESYEDLNATRIREDILHTTLAFSEWAAKSPQAKALPSSTLAELANVFDEGLAELRKENQYIYEYRAAWEAAPYAPTFNTVDAVVVQQGHILLVERGEMPGKGLWALPGGFLNVGERLVDAVVRELIEETHLKVPSRFVRQVLENNPALSKTFDAPDRSSRGRTLTTAFHIPLDTPKDGNLPEVRGGDDAKKAFWAPLSHVKSELMFEDHFDIIDWFVPLRSWL